MTQKANFNISDKVISDIVHIIQDSNGDRIKEDIRRNNLLIHNSKGFRIWDFIYSQALLQVDDNQCSSFIARRGPWEMVLLYEKESGYIFSLMREKRFDEIQEETVIRNKMHYLDVLAKSFNGELEYEYEQISLFPKAFDDEELLEEQLRNLLKNLKEDNKEIKNHVLILFETNGYDLVSVRAVMIDSNLNIVKEQSLNEYIKFEESLIIDQVDKSDKISNIPDQGLELTGKALQRIKQLHSKKEDEIKQNEEQ